MRRATALLASLALSVAACTSDAADTTTTATTPGPNVSTTAASPSTTSPPPRAPDLIIHNAKVIALDAEFTIAEAVAIIDGEIAAVGSSQGLLETAGPDTVTVDLEGRTVMPGIIDPHTHLLQAPAPDIDAMRSGQRRLLSWGVTTAGMPSVLPDQLPAFREMDDTGEIKIRTHIYLAYNSVCGEPIPDFYLSQPFERDAEVGVSVAGVKVFGDGGVCNAQTTSIPYAETVPDDLKARFNGTGDLYVTRDEVASVVADVDAAGGQTVIHALGDLAMTEALQGIDMAQPVAGPHQIHHNSLSALLDAPTLELYGKNDLTPVVFLPRWAGACDPAVGELFESLFTEEVFNVLEDRTPIVDANPGIRLSWHGDAPSLPGSAFEQLFSIVARGYAEGGESCYPSEWAEYPTVSVEEALRMVTINAAYAMGLQDRIGSIEVGKAADLIVVESDPLDPDHLMGLAANRVLATIIAGQSEFCIDICSVFGRESDIDAMRNVATSAECVEFGNEASPAGWWPGDANTDDAIGSNAGEFVDSAGFGSGIVGDSFQLSGGSIALADQPSLAAGFTLEAWVLFDGNNFDDFQAIFNNNQVFMRKNNSSEGNGLAVFIHLDDASLEPRASALSAVEPGVWIHVAGTWDGTNLYLYVNGRPEGSATRSGSLTSETVVAQIGRGETGDTSGVQFRGQIDEFSIFERPLTGEEVLAIFEAGSAGKCRP